jgi:hypothetical protein
MPFFSDIVISPNSYDFWFPGHAACRKFEQTLEIFPLETKEESCYIVYKKSTHSKADAYRIGLFTSQWEAPIPFADGVGIIFFAYFSYRER